MPDHRIALVRQLLRSPAGSAPTLHPLELLIVQASPFCNLDCSYCYLPERGDKRRMSMETLDALLHWVFSTQTGKSGQAAPQLAGPALSIVWHAGEPMAVPRKWYEDAFARIATLAKGRAVVHHFQTNAVLVDDAWCEFFIRHRVQVGVSIDGPAALHDRHRRTRDGRGTHAQVLRGLQQLQQAGIGVHAIGVLTRDALTQPDALYDFFASLGLEQVGFNVEEIEAVHTDSSLAAPDIVVLWNSFWRCFIQRVQAQPGGLRVRELDMVVQALRDPRFGRLAGNSQNQPGSILNVAHNGDFTFWSPELVGTRHPNLGAATLGNVCRENPFDALQLPTLAAWQLEIDAGVAGCRAECRYFDFCLGGAPANKLAELGHFAGTQTMACRLGQQALIDAVLTALDADLPALATTPSDG